MTVTASRPTTATPPSGWQVATQLGKVEGRRLLIHPATLITLILAIGAMWAMHRGEAPVFNRVGATTVVPLLLIAAGALVAAADASARVWVTERAEALDIAPVPPRIRAAGLLVAAATPVVVGIVLQWVAIGVLSADRPVTAVDLWDAFAGGAVILLGVAIGVAVGRWVPSRFTGPITLIVLIAAASYLGSYAMRTRFGDVINWFTPFVPVDWEPTEIIFRPTGAHLLYLIGLSGVFGCLALMRGGLRWLVVSGLLVSAIVVAAGIVGQQDAYSQFDTEAALAAYMPPLAEYTCETRGSVEYCALSEYARWIDEWAALVEGVLDVAPAAATPTPVTLRQYPTRLMDQGQTFTLGYEPGIPIGTWWSRGAGGKSQADAYPFGVALAAASWAVGMPSERTAGRWIQEFDSDGNLTRSEFVPGAEGLPDEQIDYAPYCSTFNQGRAVVALWMAAQVDERTREYLTNRLSRTQYPPVDEFVDVDGSTFPQFQGMFEWLDNGQYYPWYLLEYWIQEAYYAEKLLDLPASEVEALIAQNWEVLTDPQTTTAEAVAILGMEPLPGLGELADSMTANSGSPFGQCQ